VSAPAGVVVDLVIVTDGEAITEHRPEVGTCDEDGPEDGEVAVAANFDCAAVAVVTDSPLVRVTLDLADGTSVVFDGLSGSSGSFAAPEGAAILGAVIETEDAEHRLVNDAPDCDEVDGETGTCVDEDEMGAGDEACESAEVCIDDAEMGAGDEACESAEICVDDAEMGAGDEACEPAGPAPGETVVAGVVVAAPRTVTTAGETPVRIAEPTAPATEVLAAVTPPAAPVAAAPGALAHTGSATAITAIFALVLLLGGALSLERARRSRAGTPA
jgi:hypothetical protein